jgi:hypothetical protein
MRARLAAPADPLGCQQSLTSKQPQDPFAADPDAVLASQPGPDLAISLSGEG